MLSPFRDDEEAAGHSLEDLWTRYEALGRKVARAQAEATRVRRARFMWGLRLVVLGVTFSAAYFVGYYSSREQLDCRGTDELWP